MKTYLLAYPAGHSISPHMHRAAFLWAHLKGDYELLEVLPTDFEFTIARLRTAPNVLGWNVSLPYKERIVSHLDDLSLEAKAIGAVNTVVVRDGRLTGHNTDAIGFRRSISNILQTLSPQTQTLVLGAGGAARAAVYALLGLGIVPWVWNRTPLRAQNMMAGWGLSHRVYSTQSEIPWSQVGFLVNTTSAGLDGCSTPLASRFPQLAPQAWAYDMVYGPHLTPFLQSAEEAGYSTLGGLDMLVEQAREAFKLWTDVGVPRSVFLNVARQVLSL
ncbi:MAG: shikimate dehydrogenase [Deinococcaceae bacterium]